MNSAAPAAGGTGMRLLVECCQNAYPLRIWLNISDHINVSLTHQRCTKICYTYLRFGSVQLRYATADGRYGSEGLLAATEPNARVGPGSTGRSLDGGGVWPTNEKRGTGARPAAQ